LCREIVAQIVAQLHGLLAAIRSAAVYALSDVVDPSVATRIDGSRADILLRGLLRGPTETVEKEFTIPRVVY